MGFYKVLITDDELLIREGLRHHIDWAALGMEVMGVADSVPHALALCENILPDILITDICMQDLDGFALIDALLERGCHPAVILISSYSDFSYAQKAVRLDVVKDYLLKPIDLESLTAVLTALRYDIDSRASSSNGAGVQYAAFLKQIRTAGYDRQLFINSVKVGDTAQIEKVWHSIEQIVQQNSIPVEVVQRFCLGLTLILGGEGLLDDSNLSPATNAAKGDASSILKSYLEMINNAACSLPAYSKYSNMIETSLQIIEQRYCDPSFNLIALAAEICVTPNYLSVKFKEEVGVPFSKYVQDKQFNRAKELLSQPQYKVYEISGLVGFPDEKYFSRQFKKTTGMTPKEYRNAQLPSLFGRFIH